MQRGKKVIRFGIGRVSMCTVLSSSNISLGKTLIDIFHLFLLEIIRSIKEIKRSSSRLIIISLQTLNDVERFG